MEPEQKQQTEPIEQPSEQEEKASLIHTYERDLANAMNATDATIVQQMLTSAREREATMNALITHKKQRGWYILSSILLLLIALGAFGYSVYHFKTLTVPIKKSISVGVFSSTPPIIASGTDIRQTITNLTKETDLPRRKPLLVQLLNNDKEQLPLSVDQLFSFMEASPDGALRMVFDNVRLGVVNIDNQSVSFIIASVFDAEIASKELLLAEPTMLPTFYNALGINLGEYSTEAGRGFDAEYVYNLPVRILRGAQSGENAGEIILLYGFVDSNTVVITTHPDALRMIYDTTIGQ